MAVQVTAFTDTTRGITFSNTAYLQVAKPSKWQWNDDAQTLAIPFRVWADQTARQSGKDPVAEGTIQVTGATYTNVVNTLMTRAYTAAKNVYPGNDVLEI